MNGKEVEGQGSASLAAGCGSSAAGREAKGGEVLEKKGSHGQWGVLGAPLVSSSVMVGSSSIMEVPFYPPLWAMGCWVGAAVLPPVYLPFGGAASSTTAKEEGTAALAFASAEDRKRYMQRKWWQEKGSKKRKRKVARERKKAKRMARIRSEVQEENIISSEDFSLPSPFYFICQRCTAKTPSQMDPKEAAMLYCQVCSSRSFRPVRRAVAERKKSAVDCWEDHDSRNGGSMLGGRGLVEKSQEDQQDDERQWDYYCDDDDYYGDNDEPYNERDEAMIERQKLETEEIEMERLRGEGGHVGRKKRRRKSAILRTAEANREYWKQICCEDETAQTLEEACRWSLAVFSPSKPEATYATYARQCLLAKPERRREFVSKVYMCQRNRSQVMAVRRLDIGWHGATGPEGACKLRSKLGGRMVQMMSNSRNHPYSPSEPMRPIIFNEGPMVEEVEPFFRSFLWQQLEEILQFSKVDASRNLRTLNIGLTGVQGSRWWVYQGVAMPGTMAVMDRLPRPMLKFFARGIQLFMDRFAEEAFIKPGHSGVKFFPFCEFRHVMLRRFSDALLLPASETVAIPGVQLNLGNGTIIHQDDMNSMAEGYDWTGVVSAILDVSDWPKEKIALLKKAGLCPFALAAMMIFYGRQIVCGRADVLRLGYEQTMCFQEIVQDYEKDDMRDVQHLVSSDDASTRSFVEGLYNDRTDFIDAGEACSASMRLEAMTKLFYYSSAIDIVYRFLFYLMKEHRVKPTAGDLLGCLLFVARECSGQWLSQKVFHEFCLGNFCGKEGGFREAFGRERNLFILASIEAYHIRWSEMPPESVDAETKGPDWRPSCKQPRYRAAGALLYQGEADRVAVLEFINQGWDILSGLQPAGGDEKDGVGSCRPANFKAKAKVAYDRMCSGQEMRGIGHLSAMSVLHLAALSGLIPACYGSVAFVSENLKYGPGRFFNQFGGESSYGPDGKKKSIDQQFQELRMALEEANRYYISERTIENHGCLRGRFLRQKEFIFFFDSKMQCIFNIKYRPSAQVHELRVFVYGSWRRFDEIVVPPYATEGGWKLSTRLRSHVGSTWGYGMDLQPSSSTL